MPGPRDASASLIVAVGGSIAAYKACDLVSKLVQAGHAVDVMLTASAQRFVKPLAFAALTHRRVFTDASLWSDEGGAAGPADHLTVSANAALLVIAPCTANLIGKMAHGIADELVSTTYLGAACPTLIAPAMNERMWQHPRVTANVGQLRADGVHVVGPEHGYLAEAETGLGRMSEPAGIVTAVERFLTD